MHFNTRQSHESSNKPWFTEEDDMFEARDRDALTSANYRALGLYQDLDKISFKISNGSTRVEANVAKAARVALEQKVSAVLTALAGVDEAVGAQLRSQFDKIDAGFAATQARSTPSTRRSSSASARSRPPRSRRTAAGGAR